MPADHWSLIASAEILGYDGVDDEIKLRILSHAEKVVKSIISLNNMARNNTNNRGLTAVA